MAFLSEREQILRYKGSSIGKKTPPGGTPQGTRLGILLSLVLINMTGFPDGELEKNVGAVIMKPLNKRKPIEKAHMKYYRSRTGHYFPENKSALQDQGIKLNHYGQDH